MPSWVWKQWPNVTQQMMSLKKNVSVLCARIERVLGAYNIAIQKTVVQSSNFKSFPRGIIYVQK